MGALLSAHDLSKHYGGIQALDRVSLHIDEGEIYGLIGPNGAGKTSFFNLLCGLERADQGKLVFAGEPLPHGAHRVTARGIARTFQNGRLFPGLSALDNVLIGYHRQQHQRLWDIVVNNRRQRASENALRERALTLLGELGVAASASRLCASLPLGIQRRVEIARALACSPRLLALDEPAAGMNDDESNELARLLHSIRARGISILIIEHKVGLVMQLCDRVAVLDCGRKIAEGEPVAVQTDPAVITAWLGTDTDG